MQHFDPNGSFIVEPLPPVAAPTASWGTQSNKPEIENEAEMKQLFGIELAKEHVNPFEAAILVFKGDTRISLWVASNWVNDPEVIAAKDVYAATIGDKLKNLDKDQLAAKLLKLADEKIHGRPAHEAKDRLKALELYGKLQGHFTDNQVNTNNFINNEMKVVFVKASESKKEEVKQIDVVPTKVEPDTSEAPFSIKLVKSA